MLEIKEDKLYRDGKEIPSTTELTNFELDQLISKLYPDVPTTRDWSKKQSSWSGVPWSNMDWFTDHAVTWQEFGSCDISDKVYKAGGVRLLTLYCNKFNFFSAAQDLGINYAAMVKWFQRWKKQAIATGITPFELGLNFEQTTPINS